MPSRSIALKVRFLPVIGPPLSRPDIAAAGTTGQDGAVLINRWAKEPMRRGANEYARDSCSSGSKRDIDREWIIVDSIRSLPQVAIKNLHQEYPSFTFNIDVEQNALRKADSVVFQFPFYWYSVPGILKEWMDQVLTYGFAYGSTGDKLRGKHFLVSTTVGGPADAYCEGGYNNFTIGDLLKPLRQMSNLTGMVYHRPIVSHGMIFIRNVYNTKEEVEGRAREHAAKLHRYITIEKTEAMPSNQAL